MTEIPVMRTRVEALWERPLPPRLSRSNVVSILERLNAGPGSEVIQLSARLAFRLELFGKR